MRPGPMNAGRGAAAPWLDPVVWLPPFLALLALWPLSDHGLNRGLFLAINGWAPVLPDALWGSLTTLGDTLVAFCLALPLLRRRPDLILAVLLASIPAALLSHGIKAGLAVPRPFLELGDLVNVIGADIRSRTSFPSGHTTTAFVLASALAIGLRRRALAWLAVGVACLVGLSRIAVGAHWPADIAGGLLCGWSAGLFGHYLAQRLRWHERPRVVAAARLGLVLCCLILLFGYDSHVPEARPFERTLAFAVLVYHLLPGWRMTRPAGVRA